MSLYCCLVTIPYTLGYNLPNNGIISSTQMNKGSATITFILLKLTAHLSGLHTNKQFYLIKLTFLPAGKVTVSSGLGSETLTRK